MREKILDQNQLELYVKKAASGFAGHPVKILASHTKFEVVEGPGG